MGEYFRWTPPPANKPSFRMSAIKKTQSSRQHTNRSSCCWGQKPSRILLRVDWHQGLCSEEWPHYHSTDGGISLRKLGTTHPEGPGIVWLIDLMGVPIISGDLDEVTSPLENNLLQTLLRYSLSHTPPSSAFFHLLLFLSQPSKPPLSPLCMCVYLPLLCLSMCLCKQRWKLSVRRPRFYRDRQTNQRVVHGEMMSMKIER